MAKHFFHGKRSVICALSVALSATLSLGVLSACAGTQNPTEPDDGKTNEVTSTDVQLMRNGNFEFFAERETKHEDKRDFISSPTSWSFTSGSPSSNTTSGIVEMDEWKYMSAPSGISLIPQEDRWQKNTKALTEEKDGDFTLNSDKQRVDGEGYLCDNTTGERLTATHGTLTDAVAENARANWDKLTLYDILEFYDFYEISSEEDFDLYKDYSYSIDFEDVKYLAEDLGDGPALHEGTAEGQDALLMIHNKRDSDGVLGTAQYYTSSTTITLEAGTAASVTAWVYTDQLYHWYNAEETEKLGGKKEELKSGGGAYIGVVNTVGGQTLPEMQVKNINTDGKWEQYTFFLRANTYATTTFRLKLGLGQGTSSDNRLDAVDGYAFFDDVVVTKLPASEYDVKTQNLDKSCLCDLNATEQQKIFDKDNALFADKYVYGLDLLSEDDLASYNFTDAAAELTVGLTEKNNYKSHVLDDRTDAAEDEKADPLSETSRQSIAEVLTYKDIRDRSDTTNAKYNSYLQAVYEESMKGQFPFGTEETRDGTNVLLLLSTNGASYTATLEDAKNFTLQKNERMLISFFVKTSKIRDGYLGAGVTLVDGANETPISPFSSDSVSPVTIDASDPNLTDINKGWVQCFFFVANETDSEKTFSLKFTYGATDVDSATTNDKYLAGWAAFADLKTMPLTKSQYNYASTGSYAQKVSLTAYKYIEEKFDSAEASSDIKNELASPSSFRGALAGSNIFQQGGSSNARPDGVYAGLLNKEYTEAYRASGAPWLGKLNAIAGTDPSALTNEEWWNNIFGEKAVANSTREARQPLVILNDGETDSAPYGYISRTTETSISANSSQLISMRVKVAAGTKAYVYLLDTSDLSKGLSTLLAPNRPAYTYWYDDEGNILRCDPESEDFGKDDVLYNLGTNGLYTKASDTSANKTYYANLKNYDKDADQNLVTSDGTIAFYYNAADGKYYGYCDKDGVYTQPVEDLPTTDDNNVSILRYAPVSDENGYAAKIEIEGTEANKDKWINVSFYVRTGSEAKTYRLEVWAGDRFAENSVFPKGGYVFFDAYSSGSYSDFETTRQGAVDALLETEANRADNPKYNAANPDGESAKLDDKLTGTLALYYTFTFYDSAAYLRHDRDHEEVDYYKWADYVQSSNTEQLVWLKDYKPDAEMPSYDYYLDFSALDVAVTANEPEEEDAEEEPAEEETETENTGTNIWLVISSSLLAVVTLLAVGAVIFRAIRKKTGKKGKPVKQKKAKKAKAPDTAKQEPAPEPEEAAPEQTDENAPYND